MTKWNNTKRKEKLKGKQYFKVRTDRFLELNIYIYMNPIWRGTFSAKQDKLKQILCLDSKTGKKKTEKRKVIYKEMRFEIDFLSIKIKQKNSISSDSSRIHFTMNIFKSYNWSKITPLFYLNLKISKHSENAINNAMVLSWVDHYRMIQSAGLTSKGLIYKFSLKYPSLASFSNNMLEFNVIFHSKY